MSEITNISVEIVGYTVSNPYTGDWDAEETVQTITFDTFLEAHEYYVNYGVIVDNPDDPYSTGTFAVLNYTIDGVQLSTATLN